MSTATRKIRNFAHHATNHLLRGDISGWIKRIKAQFCDTSFNDAMSQSAKPPAQWIFGIMTTPHTNFIAHLVRERLQAHGWQVDILTTPPLRFKHDWYVVICPQMFKRLPPDNRRIAFQMEQSISSRWFSKRYLRILRSSFAVLEYSLVNIEYLAGKGIAYPKAYYMPVGATATYFDGPAQAGKDIDVLFYGDILSSPRRKHMLDALTQHFNVRIASEVFGEEMLATIRRSRVVINLHYYEHGLLEMPRIQECLSLGVPVVSEASRDQGEYPELADAVKFFEQGSIPGMIEAVRAALAQTGTDEAVAAAVSCGVTRFAFMFDRFLIALRFLPATNVQQIKLPLPANVSTIAISLPETIERRRVFKGVAPSDCLLFDGMRRFPGWVGCGLSYQAVAHHALRNHVRRVTVMEDDVLLPADYLSKIALIHEYLDAKNDQWDVFAGVIAVVHPDTQIIAVETFKGVLFLTIDRMTSTVFNIYSERALRILTQWNPNDLDPHTNTIDRFLGTRGGLRVIVALPFIAGHREEVFSTLWGFKNIDYTAMIKSSEQALLEKVSDRDAIY